MAERLKQSVIRLYGLPSYAFQIFVNVEMTFLAAFMTDFIKMPTALVGTVLMLTSVMDIVWVPTAGV
ncbi:MAG TPA: hypothetical protein DHN33_11860 [Eubacteriaceae bacterium]|nr:hypothetical protein [Eubacteriaceae bacterium]